MNKINVLKNCTIYNEKEKATFDIVIKSGQISEIIPHKPSNNYRNLNVIDVKEEIIIPGLIDIHIQGAGGADILDNSFDALNTISKTLAEVGTTSYLATTVVKPEEHNEHLKLAASFFKEKKAGAELIGIHLEGPFINPIKKGGLNLSGIYGARDNGGIESILKDTVGALKMMTIAPEIDGHDAIMAQLRRNNIVAGFAHSDADYMQTKIGFKHGINHVTHLFNAMRPMVHRDPGPIPAIFEENGITAQIISDGHHIHPRMVKFAYDNLGIERCICITDGMHGIGLPDGIYKYNGKEYESKNGAARYLDGTLIGSTMSLLNITLNFVKFTGCSFVDAINTVTLNPAKLLGIENEKGQIKKGADADIVVLDSNYNVSKTIINGELVFE